MPTTSIQNGILYYFEKQQPNSNYPPLLMIHGAGGQYANWPPHLRRMPEISTFALDLPGHGQSTGEGRRTVNDYAGDVLSFMDAVGIEQAVLAGHSMGGAISQKIALDTPERTAGLVLVGTGAKLPVTPHILDNAVENFDAVIDFIIKYSFGKTAPEALVRLGRDSMAQTQPEVLQGDFVACNHFDSRPELSAITAPTLVISSHSDKMMPAKFGKYLADHIPNAELHLFDNAGHMIMNEFPDQTAQIIKTWMEKHFG